MSEYSRGERVRVTIEGKVSEVYDGELEIHEGDDVYHSIDLSGAATVEVIEPPVEEFKPGDVVRGKASGFHFTILKDNRYANMYGSIYPREPGEFTSKHYDRIVSL